MYDRVCVGYVEFVLECHILSILLCILKCTFVRSRHTLIIIPIIISCNVGTLIPSRVKMYCTVQYIIVTHII